MLKLLRVAAVACLLLSGCTGISKMRIEKKEVTFIHVGFGLCACYLDVDDFEASADKDKEEENE